jgi:hypothetical protein
MDTSHNLDQVVLEEFQGTTGEIEAMGLHAMLEASGVPSVLVGSSTLPVLSFAVTVPAAEVERARQVIAEARAAGPVGAWEAEKESEQPAS